MCSLSRHRCPQKLNRVETVADAWWDPFSAASGYFFFSPRTFPKVSVPAPVLLHLCTASAFPSSACEQNFSIFFVFLATSLSR